MANTSQSGYPFITDYGDSRLVSNPTVPGTNVKVYGGLLAGPTYVILMYMLARLNNEVENLDGSIKDDWGFDPQHNNTTNRSNHKSGTAYDANSTKHPQHVRGTYSKEQYSIMRGIRDVLNDAAGPGVILVRMGIDWSDASVDEMHGEIGPNMAGTGYPEKVAQMINRGQLPNVPKELLTGETIPTLPDPPANEGELTVADISAITARLDSIEKKVDKLAADRANDRLYLNELPDRLDDEDMKANQQLAGIRTQIDALLKRLRVKV